MEPFVLFGLFALAVLYFRRRDAATDDKNPAPGDGGGNNDTASHCDSTNSCDSGDGGGD